MPNRIIKESSCVSESLAECSLGANLLFLRLTTKADDHGCFDARTKIIRGGVFPLMMDKVKEVDIETWLHELLSTDCIRLWVHTNGVKYGLFPNFSDHQTIRSIHKRKTPEPPESVTCLDTAMLAVASNCKQMISVVRPNPNLNPNLNPKEHKVRKRDFVQHRERFESLWKTFPPEMKKGKERGYVSFKNQVVTDQHFEDIQKALVNYIADVKQIQESKQPDLQFQNGSTWLNHRWKDYVEMATAETFEESFKRRREAGEV